MDGTEGKGRSYRVGQVRNLNKRRFLSLTGSVAALALAYGREDPGVHPG